MEEPGLTLLPEVDMVDIDLMKIKTRGEVLNICKAMSLRISIDKNMCSPDLLKAIEHLFVE